MHFILTCIPLIIVTLQKVEDGQVEAWWNARTFILNDDLGLDYE